MEFFVNHFGLWYGMGMVVLARQAPCPSDQAGLVDELSTNAEDRPGKK